VIPDHGAYTGAFMDFGDAEDDVTLEMIEDFEQMVEKHQARSSFRRATGENKIFLPTISTSFDGTARCRWFSGRLGTTGTRKIAARTNSDVLA
jgi:hypothetical protein